MSDCIFCKIGSKQIQAMLVHEEDDLMAFRDINPQAPVHIVVTTKTEEYRNVVELAAGDPGLLAELVAVAGQVATELSDGQFRLVFNTGAAAGQTVFHVHAHVLARKPSGDAAAGLLGEGTLGSV